MASTKDMVLLPGGCSLVGARQADWGWFVNMKPASRTARCGPSPALAGEGRGGGSRGIGIRGDSPHPPRFARHPPPQARERETYTDAVVTPPSTTMVWPVMKVEASEAR